MWCCHFADETTGSLDRYPDMLFPRYSLRHTLIGLTTCAVFSLVLGRAVQGSGWAIVVSVAVASLGVLLLGHAGLYVVASLLTRLVGSQELAARTSRGGLQSTPDQQVPPTLKDSISPRP